MIPLLFINVCQFLAYRSSLFFKTYCAGVNFFECKSEDLFACFNILDGVETGDKIYEDGTGDDEGDGFCEDGIDEGGQLLCEEGGCGGIDLVEERGVGGESG